MRVCVLASSGRLLGQKVGAGCYSFIRFIFIRCLHAAECTGALVPGTTANPVALRHSTVSTTVVVEGALGLHGPDDPPMSGRRTPLLSGRRRRSEI